MHRPEPAAPESHSPWMQEQTEASRETKTAQENDRNQPRHVGGPYQNRRWAHIDPAHSPRRLFPQSPPETHIYTRICGGPTHSGITGTTLPDSCRVQFHPGHQNILLCCCRVGQLAPDTLEHKQEAQTWTGNGGQTRSQTITRLLAGWRTTCSPLQNCWFCPADTEPAKEGSPGSCILDPNTHHVTPLKQFPGLSTIWLSAVQNQPSPDGGPRWCWSSRN